jgi:hypothetical protein
MSWADVGGFFIHHALFMAVIGALLSALYMAKQLAAYVEAKV